jgi:hypothetical protein
MGVYQEASPYPALRITETRTREPRAQRPPLHSGPEKNSDSMRLLQYVAIAIRCYCNTLLLQYVA